MKPKGAAGLFGKRSEAAGDAAKSVAPPAASGLFTRLADGLKKSSSRFSRSALAIFTTRKLDAGALAQLEDTLIAADLGVATAAKTVAALARDRFHKEASEADIRAALAKAIAESLGPFEAPLRIDPARKPHVILVAGVNGSGKTTTIGKLAATIKAEGRTVMLAAGDTFRAAAIEQLEAWGRRVGATVVAKPQGADPAALAYEALERAKAEGADVLFIDTAGRLQNRRELMDELAKIVRVLRKLDPTAPHDSLLVLDATVGQNALSQAEIFKETAGVTGLVVTKLDGTAKGGVLVPIAEKFGLRIHFIGVGEALDDLQPFSAEAFARALAGLPERRAA